VSYVRGDHYVICDRTGFKVRASRAREDWTGAIVRSDSWEARHPQDFVRGKKDDQRVPDARPRPTDVFTGPAVTTLVSDTAPGGYLITVSSSAGFTLDGYLLVMLDNGDTFRAAIFALLDGGVISLRDALPGSASAGNVVTAQQGADAWVNYDFTQVLNSHHAPQL
jgi:hypothetical protein